MAEETRNLEEWAIIVKVPKDAVGLVITAKILEGDNVVKLEKTLTVNDLHNARDDFMSWVGDDDYDATYTLTEEGLKAYEEQRIQRIKEETDRDTGRDRRDTDPYQ